jgi:hypothetical protein
MDWLLIGIGLVGGAFLSVSGFALVLLIRMLVRWAVGKDDDTLHRTRPRVRTRIQHSPIETEIADALAREYRQGKRA